ncbi:Avirulence (Avh) protein [Phytophthora megakarya]|uniref:RxLR effector protein n=1 Tax=Phytophthora megakarya TaxID=4795 RepID=A0A225WQM5_9STRA|nr:Avirulence (Avh) protein [Phytophthora megakarya]
MRAFYFLLVVAATFLASSEALLSRLESDETHISQLTFSGQNNVHEKRFLRTDKETDDEERGGNEKWANIFTIWRNKADAIDVMGDWLNKLVPVEKVAQHLKVTSYNKNDQNFNALVTYVQMMNKKVLGEDMTRKAAKAYLKTHVFN